MLACGNGGVIVNVGSVSSFLGAILHGQQVDLVLGSANRDPGRWW
jgi:hypothetical protein